MASLTSEYICVDLDGTLIKTDLLFESLMLLVRQKPLLLFMLPFVLLTKGRAGLKRFIVNRCLVNAELLPYNDELITFLKEEKAHGKTLVLASASDELLLAGVARHLNLFDVVLGSTGTRNLKGKVKAKVLQELYGEQGFDYAGDAEADREVWKVARNAIVVTDSMRFLRSIERSFTVRKSIMRSQSKFSLITRAIRVHQWVKNTLLVVPAIMAHEWHDIDVIRNAVIAFFAFSLCASAVYVINDLLDLEADRQHPSKKNRPFASGELSLGVGLILAPILLASSIALALVVGGGFPLVLGIYFAITSVYSLRLKKIVLVDIITLAGLYSIRILAGAVATGVSVSQWLLAFSMFLFFSLACVKRYSEILVVRKEERTVAKGRGYVAADLESISQFGASSGYISILILALYINSDEVRRLYLTPQLLWLACPLLFYWISRVWLLASRGEMHDDPIVFALRDRTSYVVGLMLIVCIFISL